MLPKMAMDHGIQMYKKKSFEITSIWEGKRELVPGNFNILELQTKIKQFLKNLFFSPHRLYGDISSHLAETLDVEENKMCYVLLY